MADEETEEFNTDAIWISSLCSSRTHKGMVQIDWGSNKAQLSIDEARQLANQILECCESALTDEIIVGFGEHMHDVPAAVALMQFFRAERAKRQQRESGTHTN